MEGNYRPMHTTKVRDPTRTRTKRKAMPSLREQNLECNAWAGTRPRGMDIKGTDGASEMYNNALLKGVHRQRGHVLIPSRTISFQHMENPPPLVLAIVPSPAQSRTSLSPWRMPRASSFTPYARRGWGTQGQRRENANLTRRRSFALACGREGCFEALWLCTLHGLTTCNAVLGNPQDERD